ncbi:MAG: SAM-dependent methyltransferase [Caldilinea sp. CFX5]|nr:SAM-dependent methyltransferase [Caldilinea sp. CFX5]
MAMTLDQVVPWGRSLAEYQHMFDLSPQALQGKILGCGDGPASFNAELTAQGGWVLSVDPIYAFSAAEIEQRVQATAATVVAQVQKSLHDYVWTTFADPEELSRHRLAAMRCFLADYEAGKAAGRYQTQSLPTLAFADASFDLALSSHFLLLYSEQLSFDFHLAAVLEMCRVAREVRIFPLLDLKCRLSSHIEPLRHELTSRGHHVTIDAVPYEFQRGANQMLRVAQSRSHWVA